LCFVNVIVFSTNFDDHGGHRGNMAQALTRWQHTVASRIALDVIHWAMRIMGYRCIAMAIKTANNLSAFFIIVDFVVTHNRRYIDHAMVHII
jgi:hypothetical protein